MYPIRIARHNAFIRVLSLVTVRVEFNGVDGVVVNGAAKITSLSLVLFVREPGAAHLAENLLSLSAVTSFTERALVGHVPRTLLAQPLRAINSAFRKKVVSYCRLSEIARSFESLRGAASDTEEGSHLWKGTPAGFSAGLSDFGVAFLAVALSLRTLSLELEELLLEELLEDLDLSEELEEDEDEDEEDGAGFFSEELEEDEEEEDGAGFFSEELEDELEEEEDDEESSFFASSFFSEELEDDED